MKKWEARTMDTILSFGKACEWLLAARLASPAKGSQLEDDVKAIS